MYKDVNTEMETAHIDHKKSSQWETYLGWAFIVGFMIFVPVILGLMIFGFRAMDLGFLTGEIVAYPVMCKDKVVGGYCSHPEFILDRTTYKPDAHRQEVLYWSEVGGHIAKLAKCAVRNRRNWSCNLDGLSAVWGFTNGKYWERTNESVSSDFVLEIDPQIYYVSRWEWMDISCRKVMGPYAACMAWGILLG